MGSVLAALPAIGTGLLAPVACPCCWATYGGLLGASFLGTWGNTYLLPLTLLCMLVALAVMATQAHRRGRYGALALAVCAATAVVAGRFWLDWRWLVICGAVLLLAAAVWNGWPRRHTTATAPAR